MPRRPRLVAVLLSLSCIACASDAPGNPFFTALNEPVDYASVTAEHVTDYAEAILAHTDEGAERIAAVGEPSFENVVREYDAIVNELEKASNNTFMLFWVSPDSATRAAGLAAFQRLDSLSTALSSNRQIYDHVSEVQASESLAGVRKNLVDDLIRGMRQAGVELEPAALEEFRTLRAELSDLSTQFSTNMNSDIPVLELSPQEAQGLPENLKAAYAKGNGGLSVPVMPATATSVMQNARNEEVRRRYFLANTLRASEVNLPILDELVAKRHELGEIMGARSFAEYNLRPNMAATPEAVWSFLDDLAERTTEKARLDLDQLLEVQRTAIDGPAGTSVQPWNTGYLRNTILKRDFNVDAEEIREYLPMESALAGMMELYQHLLGLEFRKVENPSVWHDEVEAYEVFEADALVGRFYLDLFPRPNKESWFYGVPLTPGKMHADGYEVPVAMLLGNFTRPTEDLPSLVTHAELRILFHEFGHIMNSMSYRGEFSMQSGSRPDFGEAMSQIFENWIWDYDVLKTFARHYETDEVLPKELFDNMLAARNVASGLDAQRQVRRAVYDMMLYDRFDPADPLDTDRLWTQIADRFVVDSNVDGTHPQASWIHINTHPTYYYGYLWSAVYAADMFTQFEANGLWDTETGVRYRETILANGTQRPIDEAVEAFLGRPMSSDAYIRSLGLDPGR